jgi:hypothetical protein
MTLTTGPSIFQSLCEDKEELKLGIIIQLKLKLNTGFLRETLHVELFSYFGINDEDSLVRPKISYDLADGFNILLAPIFLTAPREISAATMITTCFTPKSSTAFKLMPGSSPSHRIILFLNNL